MSLKKSNDLIGNRTRDFPVCSIVPQAITLPLVEKRVVRSDRRLEKTEY
jgi:hypothetical protein